MAGGEVQRFLAAAEHGIDWIVAQQRTDGSFCNPEDGVASYYKVPYALAITGHQSEALRLVQWVADHQPFLLQRFLCLGPGHARLNLDLFIPRVNIQNLVHPAQVKDDASLAGYPRSVKADPGRPGSS